MTELAEVVELADDVLIDLDERLWEGCCDVIEGLAIGCVDEDQVRPYGAFFLPPERRSCLVYKGLSHFHVAPCVPSVGSTGTSALGPAPVFHSRNGSGEPFGPDTIWLFVPSAPTSCMYL